MTKLLKTSLFIALVAASGSAAAQQYSGNQTQDVIVQILQSALGVPYQGNTRYNQYNDSQREAFRIADTNRDGRLSQMEVDAYRMRYENRSDRYDHSDRYDRYNRYESGIPVARVDVNRDGYISRNEQDMFLRMIELERRNDRYRHNR